MKKEKFTVTGMTCAACEANVTRRVKKLDGVKDVTVSLLAGRIGSSEERADAGLELKDVEGLGDVIVCTVVEAHELVHIIGLGCEQDDGNIRKLTDLSASGHTVHLRHHHIQNDQVRGLGLDELDGLQALQDYADALEASVIAVIEGGVMTGDLVGLWEGEAPARKVTSMEFLRAIRAELEQRLA